MYGYLHWHVRGDFDDLTGRYHAGCWELDVTPIEAAYLLGMIGESHGCYGTLVAVLCGPEGHTAVYRGGVFLLCS
jgi:hypothetical protein